MTIDEKIAFILYTIPNYFKIRKATPKALGLLMPLSDRIVAEEQIKSFFEGNMTAVFNGGPDRTYPSFCTVLGARGIGKTRLCREIRTWCKDFIETHSDVIPHFVPVYIDFSNGDDLVTANTPPSHLIGQRIAARALYECTTRELTTVHSAHSELLHLFDFHTVMEAMRMKHSRQAYAVLLVLDEFNCLVQRDPALADSVIKLIGTFMADCYYNKNTVVFPVISSTIESQVHQSIVSAGYHNCSVSMPPLSFESIEKVFRACLPESKHEWLKLVPFKRMLHLLCSNPRELHAILIEMIGTDTEPSIDNVQTLGLNLQMKLNSRVSQPLETLFSIEGFSELLHFVLAGTHFSLIRKKTELVEALESAGILYRRGKSVYLPYHIVVSANAAYGTLAGASSLTPLVDPQSIPNPGAQFTWNMFKHFDHALNPVRVSAMRIINPAYAKISELFNGALFGSKTGERVVAVTALNCVRETSHFIPEAQPFTEICVTERSSKISADNLFNYAFMCNTDNPMVDSRLFFRTDGKPIMLVKRLQYLDRTQNGSGAIPFIHVENWFKVVLNKISNLSVTYDIMGMFITNTKISELPTSVWPDNLILVHDNNLEAYYGPFVAQLANLVSIKEENEEINEEESDDEEYFTYNEEADNDY